MTVATLLSGGRWDAAADLGRALSAGADALTTVPSVVSTLPPADLPDLLRQIDEIARLAVAGRVAVTAAAIRSGVVAGSQAGSTSSWVAEHAPSQRADGASATAKAADLVAQPGNEPITAALLGGRVSPHTAVTVATEFERLRPRLRDEAASGVLDAMIAIGSEAGSRGVKDVRSELLARFGAKGDLQAEQDAAAAHVSLGHPRRNLPGCFTYELVLDAEGKAVLESAIGPLSKPQPADDGTPDPRAADQRRGQALVEVCRRATAAGGLAGWVPRTPTSRDAAATKGDSAAADRSVPTPGAERGAGSCRIPGSLKAAVYVTVTLDDLVHRTGAGRTLGTPADSSASIGTLLAPETVRKIACDAGIIPVVLGSAGEVLDLGDQIRLYNTAQLRALWFRDRECTFPGCTVPAFWCDGHHLIHWADNGPSDVRNAALLCGRHHSVVHRDRLAGRVDGGMVRWDLTPGSYGTALDEFRRP